MIASKLGAAAIALVLACPPGSAAVSQPAKTHVILVSKLAFGATPSQVRVGDTIVWVNNDIFRHSATARDKSFDLDLPPGAQARIIVKKAGVVNYYCRFHPGMTGKITVVGQLR